MGSVLKKATGSIIFTVGIFWTTAVMAVGCCVYYKGAPGSSSICLAMNPNTGQVYTFQDDNTFEFSCSIYKKDGTALGCDNGVIEVNDTTTECLDAGYVVVSEDLVGSYLFKAKTTIKGKPVETPSSCIAVPGYSVQTKSETDVACKIGQRFLNTDEKKLPFDQADFKLYLSIELGKIVGVAQDFTNLLDEKSTKYCCVPKVPQKDGCGAPGHKVVGQFTNAEAEAGLKPGVDLLPYFYCGNNSVLYPVSCNDSTTSIKKPSEEYKVETLSGTIVDYCQTPSTDRMCMCNKVTGGCAPYTPTDGTAKNDITICRSDAQKQYGESGYCKTEPINRAEVCADDGGEYQGVPLEIPDASGFNQIGTTDVKILIARAIKGVLGVIGSLSLVMFIYGGILFMTDRGSGEQAGKARDILVWTSLGLAVMFAAYAMVNFIFEAFT